MEKFRPRNVNKAIAEGDTKKILAFASAGGKAAAEKRRLEKDLLEDERLTLDALDAEMHEESMRSAARARRDDLLPPD